MRPNGAAIGRRAGRPSLPEHARAARANWDYSLLLACATPTITLLRARGSGGYYRGKRRAWRRCWGRVMGCSPEQVQIM